MLYEIIVIGNDVLGNKEGGSMDRLKIVITAAAMLLFLATTHAQTPEQIAEMTKAPTMLFVAFLIVTGEYALRLII